jgi:hypothetical protein
MCEIFRAVRHPHGCRAWASATAGDYRPRSTRRDGSGRVVHGTCVIGQCAQEVTDFSVIT